MFVYISHQSSLCCYYEALLLPRIHIVINLESTSIFHNLTFIYSFQDILVSTIPEQLYLITLSPEIGFIACSMWQDLSSPSNYPNLSKSAGVSLAFLSRILSYQSSLTW